MLDTLKEMLELVMPDVDTRGVTEETKLQDDLGFDSLAMMMLAMEIENKFNFIFNEFVAFKTVGDVCEYIENHKQ